MRMLAKLAARLLGLALALAAAACCLLAAQGYRMYRGALETRSLEEIVAAVRAAPGYTAIDQLPQLYLDAVVAVEDHRFAQHGGVDPIAILRAAVHDLRTRSLDQGGSTITQQVAKNLFFTQEKQFARKIAEVFMAFRLEDACTKDEILESYGIVKGSESAVLAVGRENIVSVKRDQFSTSALVRDRRGVTEAYPELVVDPASLDDIMVMVIRGDAE